MILIIIKLKVNILKKMDKEKRQRLLEKHKSYNMKRREEAKEKHNEQKRLLRANKKLEKLQNQI